MFSSFLSLIVLSDKFYIIKHDSLNNTHVLIAYLDYPKCGSPVTGQSHVIQCATLVDRLKKDSHLPSLNESMWNFTPSDARIVERYVRTILTAPSTREVVSQQLGRLANHLCDGLKSVYGVLDRFTYA